MSSTTTCRRQPDSYVHRIGRVGRAGREGVAITLAEPREQRQLGNIERLTKQQISLETVPTVADLRAQRIAQTRSSRSARRRPPTTSTTSPGHRRRPAPASTTLDQIALAAAKLAHDAEGAAEDDYVRDPRRPPLRQERATRAAKPRTGAGPQKKGQRGQPGSLDDRGRDNAEATGFLYVAMGRKAGMRPGDLVGAIANEVGLEGRQIGPIRISDHFRVVGVPERSVDAGDHDPQRLGHPRQADQGPPLHRLIERTCIDVAAICASGRRVAVGVDAASMLWLCGRASTNESQEKQSNGIGL